MRAYPPGSVSVPLRNLLVGIQTSPLFCSLLSLGYLGFSLVGFWLGLGGSSACGQESRMEHRPIARTDANSQLAHRDLVEKARQGTIDLYFVGDSITRRWGATDYPKFLANWQKNFHGWNAANFGWGGDTTHNILWRLENGELEGVAPKVFVLQAGTNNLPWKGPAPDSIIEEVVSGIASIVKTLRQKSPHSQILVTGLFPRPQNPELESTILAINSELEKLCQEQDLRFVNLYRHLVDAKGSLRPEMSDDGLHFTEVSYQVWADSLRPILKEILGPPATEDLSPPPTGDPKASLPKGGNGYNDPS